MEKIKKYQQLVVELLTEQTVDQYRNAPDLSDQLVCDYKTNNFQLLTVGWQGERYKFIVQFHFTIHSNGKIWLMANNTDMLIAEELVKRGVKKGDIVLGFQAPSLRPFTEYAVA